LTNEYDPTDKHLAYRTLEDARKQQKLLTGIFYIEPETPNFLDILQMTETPLAQPQRGADSPQSARCEVMAEKLVAGL
jgi:2-oxoglutarate ferredoxin oxidoreductase subunit beta